MFEKEDLEKLKGFLNLFNHLFTYIIDSGIEIARMMPSDVRIELDYIRQISYYNKFKAYSRKINQYQDIIHKNCKDLYSETIGIYTKELITEQFSILIKILMSILWMLKIKQNRI